MAGFLGVEILPLLETVLNVAGIIAAVLCGALLGVRSGLAAIDLVQGAVRFARSRRAPAPVPGHSEWPVDWPLTLSLLVRVDDGEGVLCPSVQVRGPGASREGRIRLELVDPNDEVRLTLKRGFPPEALNCGLALPDFAPPAGASVDEVLGWRWDIVLSGERSELRWQERPGPAGGLNAEAELLRGGERAPVEPVRRRFAEGVGSEDLGVDRARRRVALRKRAMRLLLAITLVAYVVVVYSGPTGEVSALRALFLYGAFGAICFALWALLTALFATDADLVPEDRFEV